MSNVAPIKPGDLDAQPIKPGVDDSLGKARAVADLLFTVACNDDMEELDPKTLIDGLASIISHIDDAQERATRLAH